MHGWEPAEVTEFEWDDGHLVRAITVREPEWNADEVAYLLASREIEFEPRNSLGIPLREAMDPKHQFGWLPPTEPTIDWSLKTRDDSVDSYYKKYPDVSRNGHVWRAPTLRVSDPPTS